MFACLLVYLFICLFIIWKWLYKLFMNMLLRIQTNVMSHSLGFLSFFLVLSCRIFSNKVKSKKKDPPPKISNLNDL